VDRIAGGFVAGRRRDCGWVWVVGEEEEEREGLDLVGVVNHPCWKDGGRGVVYGRQG
jgi:hypothetical protein